ncbi:MAG: hydroxyethylthiazole kinase [Phascolarctobacterium sp.]|nr:hydroxyethylthiazole kinase [Phascolarctobacterium sp.]
MDFKADFGKIVGALREEGPVICHFTNYLIGESCADATLAAGAFPVFGDMYGDKREISADALLFTVNMMTPKKITTMSKAAESAKDKGIPVILDLGGIMTSSIWFRFARKLLEKGYVSIARGSQNECEALIENNTGKALQIAKDAATEFKSIFIVSGGTNTISNGKQTIVLNNNQPMLNDINCVSALISTLCACCSAVTKDMFSAAVFGVVVIEQAAELAASLIEKKDGPAMFKVRLFDGIYHITTKWEVINFNSTKQN